MKLTQLVRAIQVPMELPTHKQMIKNLYKRAYRNLESHADYDFVKFRVDAVMLRARFDENKNVNDVVKIRTLVQDAEKELWDNLHGSPIKFPESPGGVAYQREHPTPDWVMDYWHPLERAQYPEYFKRREQRKKEFLVWWEKQYGKPSSAEGH